MNVLERFVILVEDAEIGPDHLNLLVETREQEPRRPPAPRSPKPWPSRTRRRASRPDPEPLGWPGPPGPGSGSVLQDRIGPRTSPSSTETPGAWAMPRDQAEAIVLRTFPLADQDKIAVLLSRDRGVCAGWPRAPGSSGTGSAAPWSRSPT